MPDHQQFEWDAAKAESNLAKHGVSFNTAAYMLAHDEDQLEIFDEDHSVDEDRWITIGAVEVAPHVIVLIVAWTARFDDGGEVVTRIISARKANARERAQYEEAK